MTIEEETGVVSWQPTSVGAFDVEVQAMNSVGSDTQMFSVVVNAVPGITSTPVTSVELGTLYSYTVVATGNPAPVFTLVDAPDGMVIVDTTGVISWEPSAVGEYTVTVEANNSVGTDTQRFGIAVNAAPAIFSSPVTMAESRRCIYLYGGGFW